MAKWTNGPVLDPKLLDKFKFEIADDLGIELKRGYNGDITAREAGRIGGRIGGNMVKVMVRMAEEAMAHGGPQSQP